MKRGGVTLGNRLAPPRFVLFLVLLLAAFFGYWQIPGANRTADAAALSFDLAAAVFLLSLLPLLRDSDVTQMRAHAAANDANRVLVLAITTIVTMVVLAAISGELPGASGGDRVAMVKLVGTLLLTWLFANSVYALHYAHLFYTSRDGKDAGGIDFPGENARLSGLCLLQLHAGHDLPDIGHRDHQQDGAPHRHPAFLRGVRVQHRRDCVHDKRPRLSVTP